MNKKIEITRDIVIATVRNVGAFDLSYVYEELDQQSGGQYGEQEHRQIQVILAGLLNEGLLEVVPDPLVPIPQLGYTDMFQWKDTTAP